MFSRDKSAIPNEQHPAAEVLVRFVDGMLTPAKARDVQSHLDLCWECRRDCARFQDAIAAYTDFQEYAWSEEVVPPPQHWSGFERKMNQLESQWEAESRDRKSILNGLRGLLAGLGSIAERRTLSRWTTAAVGLAAAALIAGLLFVLPQKHDPISAATLLERAEAAERATSVQSGHVRHRVIRFEQTVVSTGTPLIQRIEIWEAGGTKAARRLYGQQGRLVAAEWVKPDGTRLIYEKATLRSGRSPVSGPLSENAIWRLAPSTDTFVNLTGHAENITVEEQPTVYVLRYKSDEIPRDPKLLSASLTLRRSDMHPVEQRVQVERNGQIKDYRFVEVGFDQQPATDVAANIFEVDAELVPAVQKYGVRVVPQMASVTADMVVDVLDRLDRAHSLLRGELQLSLSPTRSLLVQGIVEDEVRKSELAVALNGINSPAISVQISTVAEATQVANSVPPKRILVRTVDGQAVSEPLPLLREHLARSTRLSGAALDQEVTRYSNAVLAHSSDAQLHVMTLKQIFEVLADDELAALSPAARSRWADLVQRHAQAAQLDFSALQHALKPLAGVNSDWHPETPTNEDMRATSERLVPLSSTIYQMLGQSLADSSSNNSIAGRKFWQSLIDAEALASAIVAKAAHP